MRTTWLWGSALLLTLAAAPVDGQVEIGPAVGTNLSSLVLADLEADATFSRRNGVLVGGVVSIAIAGRVALRLEPAFIQKGGTAAAAVFREEATLKASMVEMPLFVTVAFGETTRPYLMVGPAVGIVVSSRLEGTDSGVVLEGDLLDVTERVDFGLGVGAGVSHPLGRLTPFVEGRFIWGMSNLMKSGEATLTAPELGESGPATFDKDEDDYRYRGLQVLVGFTVDIGGR